MDLAIIDATHEAAERAADGSDRSRYTTPIANTPLICHILGELAESGIAQATIIAGPGVRQDLERVLGRDGTSGVEVSYVDTPPAERRRTVLAELNRALDQAPVLLHPGDCLFRGQVMTMRDRYHAGDVDSVLPEQASVASRRYPADSRLSETLLVLGPGTRPLLGDLLTPASDGEDLIGVLLHSDCRLAVCELTEQWCYSEATGALLTANRMMLDSLPPLSVVTGDFEAGNQLHGRVAIADSAFVSNSVIHGPVAIADRAVVEDSFIGPYTAVGIDAVLSGAEIDDSMVLAGAEIRHPGYRIEASIIGERSQVMRSFDLPRGVHMRLRADSHVSFS